MSAKNKEKNDAQESIAIIGLGCRFPGANSAGEFWRLLHNGVDAISKVPPDRWDADFYYDPKGGPGKINTRFGGFLKNIDQFDPQFFEISPREAEKMDPQQRLIMEVTWEALEHAGIDPDKLSGTQTGVFVGISHSNYEKLILENAKNFDAYCATGNALTIAANRLSYFLNLKGPSLAIDTACSSSLVAVHQAVISLRGKETDTCLVGGVNIILAPESSIVFSQAGMMAADGRCKTFSAEADGYTRGEGCGMVVLKRMEDALRDGDNICAVIRGSAVNQDGSSNGLTAPHGPSQVEVIRRALDNAHVKPEKISYLEAHGTGTSLGDPIEMNSIIEALIPNRTDVDICHVGSVKTNIGHLESAAGIAGLIKVILSCQHKEIPAHLHLKKINPLIDLKKTPFKIPRTSQAWRCPRGMRIAGLSSFGFGGTNCHIIIQEPPERDDLRCNAGSYVFTLSAKSKAVLKEMAQEYSRFIKTNGDLTFADICWTVNTGRKVFKHRWAVTADSIIDLCNKLDAFAEGVPIPVSKDDRCDPIIDDFLNGKKIDWMKFYEGASARRVELPTYPFQRKRYWMRSVTKPAKKQTSVPEKGTPAAVAPKQSDTQGKDSILAALKENASQGSEENFQGYIREQVANELRLSPREVDINAPLIQMGLDSIMALLLNDQIKEELGIEIPQTEFMGDATIAKLAQFLNAEYSQLKDRKRQVKEPAPSTPRPKTKTPVEKISREGKLPVSFTQRQLWIVDQMHPVNNIYNLPFGIRVKGALDVKLLKESFRVLANRQESLRTTYASDDGNPYQIINPKANISFEETDLSKIDKREKQGTLDRLLKEHAHQPFDLVNGPLWRVSLFRLSDDEHVMLLNFHHMIFDGWSSAVVFNELTLIYQAFMNQKAPKLNSLPVQCVDYIAWHEQHLQGKNLEKLTDYWSGKLQGVPLSVHLPFDNKRPRVQSFKGTTSTFTIDADLKGQMEKLSKNQRTTLSTLMMSALSVLMSYHSQQDDLCIATPIADRQRSETKALIGMLVNFVPLRFHVDGNKTFNDQLIQAQKTTHEALVHQDLPFDKILEASFVPKNLGLNPLSQVVFNFQQVPVKSQQWPQAQLNFFYVDTEIAQTDLAVLVREDQDRLSGHFVYSTDLFKEETIRKLAAQYVTVLKTIVHSSHLTVDELLTSSRLDKFSSVQTSPQSDEFEHYLNQSNLTQNQLLMWAAQKLDMNNPAFNSVVANTIHEFVDMDHLQNAFTSIVEERDSLRTVIIERQGMPRQKVMPEINADINFFDFSEQSDPQAQADRWMKTQVQRPFRINEQLFYCALLKVADEKFIWFINQHHLITDGWSQRLLWQDLVKYYKQSLAGHLNGTVAKTQFSEFVKSESEFRRSENYTRARQYWQEEISLDHGALEVFGEATVNQSTQIKRESRYLGHAPTDKLNQFFDVQDNGDKISGATPFHVFIALYAVFLARISGKKIIHIGIPLHNRRTSHQKDVMGLLMHIVPICVEIRQEESIKALIEHVAQRALKAMEFGQYVVRPTLERPVFDAMLNYHTWAGDQTFVKGKVTGQWIHPEHAYETIALNINSFDLKEGSRENLRLDFDFNVEVFDQGKRDRCIRYFFNCIESAFNDLTQPVHRIPVLSQEEVDRQIVQFNATSKDYPLDQCLHELFEARVKKTPEVTALIFKDKRMTYQELDQRAGQLAGYIRSMGLKDNTLVGISIERSFEMLIGLLGILKAGAAYLPLDPTYPKDRLVYMCHDAGIPLLLTQVHLKDHLAGIDVKTVCLDRDWDEITAESKQHGTLQVKSCPDNLAYCIYTSGSTGKPKGALISHKSIVNRLLWMQDAYRLTPEDKVMHKTPFSFDVSVWELFWPIITGASMVIAEPDAHKDPEYLRNLIIAQDVTTMHFVPSMLRTFLDTDNLHEIKTLKNVICSGEALPADVQHKFLNTIDSRLHNLYGPTEAAVDVSYWECRKNDDKTTVPIGRPIANIQLYILNEYRQPVPLGVPGELYIGGVGVGRSYLHREELTKEKFLPNPFHEGTMYRTGDLARYLPDGNIEFLGRIDHQVKIRGFRIECGEIEQELTQLPDVRQAVVLAVPGPNGDHRLVAYIVCEEEKQPTSQLRNFLKKNLPEYMIPSVFVYLDTMPLTPNGKLDRQSLPLPDGEKPQLGSPYEPPGTDIEKKLAAIWARVLGLQKEKIGIHDNFIELGGDSITGIQIISLANQEGIVLKPMQLFENQTIGELAQVAGEGSAARSEQGLITGDVPLTPIQQWFFEGADQEAHHFNQSVMIEVPSSFQPKVFEEAFRRVIRHHDGLRLEYTRSQDMWQQVNAAPKEGLPFEVIDLANLSEDTQKETLRQKTNDLQTSFHLSSGPLIRVALFAFGNLPGRLLIILHHVLVDGISWRIFLEDLQLAYQQLSNGIDPVLPPKTNSFKTWADHLKDYGNSGPCRSEYDYWIAEVKGSSGKLPVDFPVEREKNIYAHAKTISVGLNRTKTKSLLQEVHDAYNTQVQDVLLTALGQAMTRFKGEDAVLIDIEGHGREELFPDIDITRTVGWFTSIFPVHIELKKEDSSGESLKSVKEKLRGVPHHGIGYGILRYLAQDQQPSQEFKDAPQAGILFNYFGIFHNALDASPLFRIAKESCGMNTGPRLHRRYLFEVNCVILEGRLQVHWIYCEKIHREETAQQIANMFIQSLESLIDHCLSSDTAGYTPSDFPEADLTQEELDALVTQVGNG